MNSSRSYTWSHAIDDSVDLQSTTTPQDSFFPGLDRSTSLFDQRHRFVFSGVYQTGRLSGDGFASKVFSNWTFAPLIEFGSGRPFNIITGNGDNLQLSSLTGRPIPPSTLLVASCALQVLRRRASCKEPCGANFDGTLISLDGNLRRNAGITPWTVFNDLRVAKRIYFGEAFQYGTDCRHVQYRESVQCVSVSPLFTNAGQATAAYDPRQFQFAIKLNW